METIMIGIAFKKVFFKTFDSFMNFESSLESETNNRILKFYILEMKVS